MAIVCTGITRCPLCGEALEEADPLVATSHFMTDPFHPLWSFSDTAMHKPCFLQWERREEFIRLFNDAMALAQYDNETLYVMQEDGEVIKTHAIPKADLRIRHRTALHDAAETGSTQDVLAQWNADPSQINTPDEAGITPLHLAVAYNEPEVVEALLRQGANVHDRTDLGQSVLHTACIQGRAETVRLLIGTGEDVNARDPSGKTPLHLAAATSDVALVSALLAAGANAEARDKGGRIPLHDATARGQRDVIGVLLGTGIDIDAYDSRGQTALHIAAAQGQALLLRLLLSRGADAASRDAEGRTPREIAAAEGHTMAVRLIDGAVGAS